MRNRDIVPDQDIFLFIERFGFAERKVISEISEKNKVFMVKQV